MSSRNTRGKGRGTSGERKGTPAVRQSAKPPQAPAPMAPRAPEPTKGLATVEPKRITVTQDDIARAAYFRWLERGGDARSNWLEAEAELRGKAALGMG